MVKENCDNIPRVWQRMLSGCRLDLLNPSPSDIEITDIARGLARVARWNGQTHGVYTFSVAQHSLLVEQIFSNFIISSSFSPQFSLQALLHDAAEYVIGDMISPFKAIIGKDYQNVEMRLQHAICVRFSFSDSENEQEVWKSIKKADCISAFYEAIHLADFSFEEAVFCFGKPPSNILKETLCFHPKPTKQVEAEFLSRFFYLDSLRKE